MQLYSLQFVFFILVVLVAYYVVGKVRGKYQWVVLLVGSMGFYLSTGWQNLFFILLTSFSTWAVGLWFARKDAQCKEERAACANRAEKKAVKQRFQHRKWLGCLGIMLLNFGVLGYIKYWNVLLGYFGLGESFLMSQLLLPLGISFFTFQSVGYLVDTYNGKYAPEGNYAKYLLFVSFFPQLIQGPINRYDDMAQQLFAEHHLEADNTKRALLLIGYGLLKKYAIADVLVNLISHTLDTIDVSTPGCIIVFGIFLYTIQQYGDFSGGIDIVRGVSQLFGIKMAENFRQPYFATSLADFWRRWHISLGAWMRDYVFYPLALRPWLLNMGKWVSTHVDKRLGLTVSACISNVIVFLLVGLWHGAEMHYVLWGLYQGIVIAISDLLRPFWQWLKDKTHVNAESAPYHVFCILRTFMLVNIGRYFDRLQDPASLFTGFHNTVFNFRPDLFMAGLNLHPTFALKLVLLFALLGCIIVFTISVFKERGVDVAGRILAAPAPLRFALYTLVGVMVAFSFTIAVNAGGFLYANF